MNTLLQLLWILFLCRISKGDINCTEEVTITGGNVEYPKSPTPGGVLKYVCPENTRPHPVAWRVCMSNGMWSLLRNTYFEKARTASCVPYMCVGSINLENGHVYPRKKMYRVGDTIQFECEEGYGMFGSPNRTCLPNGEWSGSITICDKGETFCPNPGIPLGGYRQGRFFKEGKVVQYSCFQSLVLRGSSSRTCKTDGQWSGKEPRCEGRHSYDDPKFVAEQLVLYEELMAHAGTNIHIYFLLCTSRSVGTENFQKAKEFVKGFIDKTTEISNGVTYSVVTFDSLPHILFQQTHGHDDLTQKLWDFEISDATAGRNIGGALEMVLKDIKKQKSEKPPQHKSEKPHKQKNEIPPKQIILIVTDGKHTTGASPHKMARNIADIVPDAEKNLDIFTLGIGDAHKGELEEIASKKEEQRAFYLRNFDDLKMVTMEMYNQGASGCGGRGMVSRTYARISRGEMAKEKQWPWQVYIKIKDEDGPDRVYTGGGSIISKRWILTAAHNVISDDGVKVSPNQVTVVVGNINKNKGKEMEVEMIEVHNNYREKNGFDSDIALLKLKQDLELSNKIWPVCLPCTSEMDTVLNLPAISEVEKCIYQDKILTGHGGKEDKKIYGFISGWGKRSHLGYRSPNELYYAEIAIQNRVACSDATGNLNFTENMFCAIGDDGADACHGDSGGPFVVKMNRRWIQVGIISFGNGTRCGKNSLGFYTSVPKMMGWILHTVKESDFM
ncbi:complement C2 isoform X2 [Microcaecilia unicolor]|uniref:C3/C5 convertase n=1 Tax=Microcaecilia unicolor TaxID=1415580 RepID=A0A6P7YMH2_9AMPH|nr:complement C2-like isoform X2 [Microcaecilia unicolor]